MLANTFSPGSAPSTNTTLPSRRAMPRASRSSDSISNTSSVIIRKILESRPEFYPDADGARIAVGGPNNESPVSLRVPGIRSRIRPQESEFQCRCRSLDCVPGRWRDNGRPGLPPGHEAKAPAPKSRLEQGFPMMPPPTELKNLDWAAIASQMDSEGYAVLPGLLAPEQIHALAQRIGGDAALRHEPLSSLDLGRGDLYVFQSDLPDPLAAWRKAFYEHLAPIANRWNEALDAAYRYPALLEEFLQRNREAGQTRPLSHLSRLGESDYMALHRQSEGEHVFPMQVVARLAAAGTDFTGGEFVMTEQR